MSERQATILVVDDTPENIDVLVGILHDEYRVRAAINGEMALQQVKRNPPDLILLDIMMPGLSGYDVCTALKSSIATRSIPIIFVTAMTEMEDEQKGLELGAVDYLTKPVSAPIVKARVKNHLALYDQSRHLEALVQQRTQELANTRRQVIETLGRAAEFKDNQTGMHVVRMSHYSHLLGLANGMSDAEAELLMAAAPMHDIGKIGVPDQILKKKGPLDEDEWRIMHKHPEMGLEILGQHDSELLQLAGEIALTHHEKFDGSGYPQGLKGDEIPVTTRIITIADVFDALTTARPYKLAWTVEKTIALLRKESGTHFDPQLVDKFIDILPRVLEIKAQYGEDSAHKL